MNNSEPGQPTKRLLAGAVLAGLFLAACGSASTTTQADTASGNSSATTTSATGGSADAADGEDAVDDQRLQLPAVNVLDVGTGSEVQLTSLADDDRPTLLWFYAPH